MGIRRQALMAATLPFLLSAGFFYADEAAAQQSGFFGELDFSVIDPTTGLPIEDNNQEISVNPRIVSDNGLQFSSRIEVDAEATFKPDEYQTVIRGSFGTVRIDPPSGPDPQFIFTVDEQSAPSNFADTIVFRAGTLTGAAFGTAEQFIQGTSLGAANVIGFAFSYVATNDNTTLSPDNTLAEAWLAAPTFGAVSANFEITFADLTPGPQGPVINLAETTTLRYGLQLNSSSLSQVPLPPAAWLFLGALGILFGLKRFRAQTG